MVMGDCATTLAIPKSTTLAWSPAPRRMFSGFMSRWTIPREWATARPWRTPDMIWHAWGTGIRVRRSSRFLRGSPFTSSSAM